MQRFFLASSLIVYLVGCVDLRSFEGTWQGPIVNESAVRQGFAPDVLIDPLVLSDVDLQDMTAILTTSDKKFDQTKLFPIQKASNDAIASISFDGNPLRTYLMFASLNSEEDSDLATIFISLFTDDHVELRITHGNDLFGVFYVHRKE